MKIACLGISYLLTMAGCNQSPFQAQQHGQWQQQQQQLFTQRQEVLRRAGQLDANNRDLHAQLAQSQQQVQVYSDELKLLRQQLSDNAQQLADERTARKDAQAEIAKLEAAGRQRGSATIFANSSGTTQLDKIEIPGLIIRQDAGKIRIELPVDRLFQSQTAVLAPNAFALLDQIAAEIKKSYPQQLISVEGHTDSSPVQSQTWRNNHQLSASQAMVVFDQLVLRHRIPSGQMKVVGYGASQPVVSNGTPAGKRRNRRVELVILQQTINSQ